MGDKGTATLSFGTGAGTTEASVVVTGQTGILSNSHCEAHIEYDSTATHSADEHLMVKRDLALACGTIVVGTGFTIYASTGDWRLTGDFTVRWVWV